jgi:gamma-glutamylcyclotransferase (GGCT)/AIG2-like uncharacterized protein YtfP
MSELLFSYGTLQLEKVQIESFGRKLKGRQASLSGYKLEQVSITDPLVLSRSEKAQHPIAVPGKPGIDFIQGTLFEVTKEELLQADEYEVSDYKRVSVHLPSGETAWIYIRA